jgi:hypothetical protein
MRLDEVDIDDGLGETARWCAVEQVGDMASDWQVRTRGSTRSQRRAMLRLVARSIASTRTAADQP